MWRFRGVSLVFFCPEVCTVWQCLGYETSYCTFKNPIDFQSQVLFQLSHHLTPSEETSQWRKNNPCWGFRHQFSAQVLGGCSELCPGRSSQSCWLSRRLKERSGCTQLSSFTRSSSSNSEQIQLVPGHGLLRFRGVGAPGTEGTERPGRPPTSWAVPHQAGLLLLTEGDSHSCICKHCFSSVNFPIIPLPSLCTVECGSFHRGLAEAFSVSEFEPSSVNFPIFLCPAFVQ